MSLLSNLDEELANLMGNDFVKQYQGFMQPEKPSPVQKPKDVNHTIPVTLEQLCGNYTVTLKAEKRLPCRTCNGQGNFFRLCTYCNGSKYNWQGGRMMNCETCKTHGTVKMPCKTCSGKKFDVVENVFKITVPKGTLDKTKIRLEGKGDNLLGNPKSASDILCTVSQKPHNVFKRVYNDLYMRKTITLKQAICGCNFTVKHVDGRKLLLSVYPGEITKPGSFKCALNQGMPKVNSNKRGRLIILFNVNFPNSISKNVAMSVKPIFDEAIPDNTGKDKIQNEHEVYNLVTFDPKEQKYNVPFKTGSAYADASPMKQRSFNEVPSSCKQQ